MVERRVLRGGNGRWTFLIGILPLFAVISGSATGAETSLRATCRGSVIAKALDVAAELAGDDPSKPQAVKVRALGDLAILASDGTIRLRLSIRGA